MCCLHEAVDKNNLHQLELLLELGHNPNQYCDKIHNLLLNYAIEKKMYAAVRILTSKKFNSNINKRDRFRENVLFYAVRKNDIIIVKILISNGANLNVFNYFLETPLSIAINNNNNEIASFLIKKGTVLNKKNSQGETPLIIAVKNNNFVLAKLLLGYGSEVNIVDKNGNNSLFYSIINKNIEIANELINNRAKIIINSNQESLMFEDLIKNIINMYIHHNFCLKPTKQILKIAIANNSLNHLKILIKNYNLQNLRQNDIFNLIKFSINNDWSLKKTEFLLKILLQKTINNSVLDKLLFYTSSTGIVRASKLLLDFGANINAIDSNGQSPIFYAIKYEKIIRVEMLVELFVNRNADLCIIDNNGESVINIAQKKSYHEIVLFMKKELAKYDIVDVISNFILLQKRGANYVGNCPFCQEKRPTFAVSQFKGQFKCFNCGKSGNVLDFIVEFKKNDKS